MQIRRDLQPQSVVRVVTERSSAAGIQRHGPSLPTSISQRVSPTAWCTLDAGRIASQSVLARGPWHSRAAAHREGHSGAGGGGTFTAWRETPQAEEAVALVAWSSRHHAGPRSALEILRKALRPGTHLPLLQANPWVDNPSPQAS